MPFKCYDIYENETLSFVTNSNKTINTQFFRFPPILLPITLENETLVKYKYCGPFMQLIQEFAIKEKAK